MKQKEHWESVYSTKPSNAVSWFQEHAEISLRFIQSSGVPLTSSIIDVGGGASILVDDLLQNGYSNLTVLDLSASALDTAKERLGLHSHKVKWLEADITNATLPVHSYDLWHDRAVFHFLTSSSDRRAYIDASLRSVKPGGHVIIATFAEDGPTKCSGLPVMRYSAIELHAEFGASFSLVKYEKEKHHTPLGSVQKFIYCHFRKVK